MSSDQISVPRELMERALRELMDWEAMDDFAAVKRTHDELRALLAQRCTCPSGDGSLRWPCPVCPPEPVAEIVMFGGECKEVAWRKGMMPEVGAKLYRHPPSQATMMLPVKKSHEEAFHHRGLGNVDGWNACFDEFKRLNPGITEAAPPRKS